MSNNKLKAKKAKPDFTSDSRFAHMWSGFDSGFDLDISSSPNFIPPSGTVVSEEDPILFSSPSGQQRPYLGPPRRVLNYKALPNLSPYLQDLNERVVELENMVENLEATVFVLTKQHEEKKQTLCSDEN